MTSQPVQQTITISVLPIISRSKGNLAMKLDQVIEDEIFFFKNDAENKLGELVPDLFLFFKKAL